MSDPITRLNAALEGRYRVERELAKLQDPHILPLHDSGDVFTPLAAPPPDRPAAPSEPAEAPLRCT